VSRALFAVKALAVVSIACGCTIAVFGDNLDPVAPHRMGPGTGLVFTGLTVEGEDAIGLEVFALGEQGPTAARELMIAARPSTEVVAAYLRPGKYELGGLELDPRGGGDRFVAWSRHRRDEYAYFEVLAGACNWIGDYAIDASAIHGVDVSQRIDEQAYAATSRAFRARFADLAGRCSTRVAVIER
jgi:hypothetical protein